MLQYLRMVVESSKNRLTIGSIEHVYSIFFAHVGWRVPPWSSSPSRGETVALLVRAGWGCGGKLRVYHLVEWGRGLDGGLYRRIRWPHSIHPQPTCRNGRLFVELSMRCGDSKNLCNFAEQRNYTELMHTLRPKSSADLNECLYTPLSTSVDLRGKVPRCSSSHRSPR
jgi:hypothetical protein